MDERRTGLPAERGTFSKHRVQGLSDGIFAIAMTLLVLDLKAPTSVPHGQLWAVLRGDAGEWGSFVLTFAIAAIFWRLQYRVLDLLEHVSTRNLNLSFVTLGLVTVLPFSTSLIAHLGGERLARVLYFANQLAIALSLAVQMEVARFEGGLHADPGMPEARSRVWWVTVTMLTTFLGAVWLPGRDIWYAPVAVGLYRKVVRPWRARARARA